MYIVYSNNCKTGEITSRGSPYSSREDAIKSLIKEAESYIIIYKSCTPKLSSPGKEPGWYIQRDSLKEEEVHVYNVTDRQEKGWLSNYTVQDTVKFMTFSIMSIPDPRTPPEIFQEDSPRITHTYKSNPMLAELTVVLKNRREAIGDSQE